MLFSLQSLVNRSPAAIEADANEIVAPNEKSTLARAFFWLG